MRDIVVDASAVAAVLFNEQESEPILAAVAGALVAPTLLLYELASVCSAKLARTPAEEKIIVRRYRLFADLDIALIEPDWTTLPLLARKWEITAYDAAYLQIALQRRVGLVTLDARLAAAYDHATGSAR